MPKKTFLEQTLFRLFIRQIYFDCSSVVSVENLFRVSSFVNFLQLSALASILSIECKNYTLHFALLIDSSLYR